MAAPPFVCVCRALADGALWVHPRSHIPSDATGAASAGVSELSLPSLGAEPAAGARPAVPVLAPSQGTVCVFHRGLFHAGGPCLSPAIRYATCAPSRFATCAPGSGGRDAAARGWRGKSGQDAWLREKEAEKGGAAPASRRWHRVGVPIVMSVPCLLLQITACDCKRG